MLFPVWLPVPAMLAAGWCAAALELRLRRGTDPLERSTAAGLGWVVLVSTVGAVLMLVASAGVWGLMPVWGLALPVGWLASALVRDRSRRVAALAT